MSEKQGLKCPHRQLFCGDNSGVYKPVYTCRYCKADKEGLGYD